MEATTLVKRRGDGVGRRRVDGVSCRGTNGKVVGGEFDGRS